MITGTSQASNPSNGNFDSNSIQFNLTIVFPNKGPPVFTKDIKNIKLNVTEFFALTLPKIIDPDFDDSVQTPQSVNFGAASSFITGKSPNYIIKPISNDTDVGVYEV